MELKGKAIAFLGDSITEGVGVENCEMNRYDNVLKRKCELRAVYNYGISGTRIAHQRKPSEIPRHDLCFCGRAFDLNPDADIIVVYGGINDYIHGDAPFGVPEDNTPETFCGAVNFLMNFLKEQYPGRTIVFMTPAHMTGFDNLVDSKPSTLPMKYPDAKPVVDYVEIVNAAGRKHGVAVLDLYHNLGIDPNDPEQSEKYTADGLHFNDEGHAVLADCLIDFLKKLD